VKPLTTLNRHALGGDEVLHQRLRVEQHVRAAELVGWDVAAGVLAGSVWSFVAVLDAPATARVSTREDDSHAAVDVIVVVASLVSLVGVAVGLAHARQLTGPVSWLLTLAAVLTVFVSWFTMHTLFALRYARLYYREPVGGITFGEAVDPPDYLWLRSITTDPTSSNPIHHRSAG
jgi:uncharacterized membrane protein